MGDRCWMYICCHEKHAAEVADAMGFTGSYKETHEAYGKIARFEDDQANYGGTELCNDLQSRGIPFFGGHDAGMEYGACIFCCDGKETFELAASEGEPIVTVQWNKKIGAVVEASDLKAINDYVAVFRTVLRMLQVSRLVKHPWKWRMEDFR